MSSIQQVIDFAKQCQEVHENELATLETTVKEYKKKNKSLRLSMKDLRTLNKSLLRENEHLWNLLRDSNVKDKLLISEKMEGIETKNMLKEDCHFDVLNEDRDENLRSDDSSTESIVLSNKNTCSILKKNVNVIHLDEEAVLLLR